MGDKDKEQENLKRQAATDIATSNPAAFVEGLDPEAASIFQKLMATDAQNTAWGQTESLLFPTGIPAESGIEGGLSNFLPSSQRYDVYTDPETGAIKYANGVIVNPSKGVGEVGAVLYGPNSTAAGSLPWLRKAATSWSPAKTNEWRTKLYKLGYDVAKKGKFDAPLAGVLDTFFKVKYFYGEELAADGSFDPKTGARDAATAAYDPIQMKQDIRFAFRETIGDDPTESELDTFYKRLRSTMVQTIRKGGTTEHAFVKTTDQLAEDVIASPAGQVAQRRSDAQGLENTDLADSFVSLGQLLS